MYDHKRSLRECTNHLTVFDTQTYECERIMTNGCFVAARRNHTAAIFAGSMLVFGGLLENG
jgi:hypothetical protein